MKPLAPRAYQPEVAWSICAEVTSGGYEVHLLPNKSSVKLKLHNLSADDPMWTSRCLVFTCPGRGRPQITNVNAAPSIDLSWYKDAMRKGGDLTPADLVPIISGITQLLKARYFSELDTLLKRFDPKVSEPEVMVAMLRTTFPAKRMFYRNWSNLLAAVRKELALRNLDAAKILRGLA